MEPQQPAQEAVDMELSSFMTLRHPNSVLAAVVIDDPDCVITACQDHVIRVWDGAAWTCLQSLTGHSRAVLALTHTHNWLLSASSDATIRLHDMSAGLPRTEARHGPKAAGGEVAVVGGFTTRASIRVGAGAIYSLACTPPRRVGSTTIDAEAAKGEGRGPGIDDSDSMRMSIFAGCQDTNVYRVDVTLSRPAAGREPVISVTAAVQFVGHQGFVYSLSLCRQVHTSSAGDLPGPVPTPEEDWLCVAGSGDGCIRVWRAFEDAEHDGADAQSAKSTADVVCVTSEQTCNTGKPAVTRGSEEIRVPLRDSRERDSAVIMLEMPEAAATREVIAVLHAPRVSEIAPPQHPSPLAPPSHVAAQPNDSSPATPSPIPRTALPGDCGGIYALAFYARDLYAGAQDGSIRVWDADSRHMKYVLTGHEAEVLSLCVADDPVPMPAHAVLPQQVHSLFSPTGAAFGEMGQAGADGPGVYGWLRVPALLCSGSADRSIRIWSTRTYSCLRVVRDCTGIVLGLAARAHMLFAAASDTCVHVFDTTMLLPASSGMGVAHAQTAWPHGQSPEPRLAITHGGPPLSIVAHRQQPGQFAHRATNSASSGPPAPHGATHAARQAHGTTIQGRLAHGVEFNFTPSAAGAAHAGFHWGAAHDVRGAPTASAAHAPSLGASGARTSLVTEYGVDLSQQGLLSCLRELVAIPSVSLGEGTAGTARDVNACWRAARYLHDLLLRIGAECRFVQGTPGSNPMVLARIGGWNAGTPTVAIHGHYDVQPAGEAAAWESSPFVLTGRDGYLYARGASDNKGPLVALIFAVARCMEARKERRRRQSRQNLDTSPRPDAATESEPGDVAFVFALEGEGENGSVGFRDAILHNLEWFAHTSVILNCNNTWIGETVPCLTYGMRGLVKMRVEVQGPSTDLHSGLDGGVTHEPLLDLCGTLTSVVDPTCGKIAVPGLYDMVAPLSPDELALYTGLDFDVQGYMSARGIQGVYTGCNLHCDDGASAVAREPAPHGALEDDPTTSAAPTAIDTRGDSEPRYRKRARMVELLLETQPADGNGTPSSVSSEKTSGARAAAVARADLEAHALHTGSRASAREPGRTLPPPSAIHRPDPAELMATGTRQEPSPVTQSHTADASPPALSASPHATEPKAETLSAASSVLLRRWREPALTVHGITCSAANDSIIPRKATAFLSIRTVPNMTSAKTFDAVAAHLRYAFAARRSVNKLTVAMTSHAAWWLQSPHTPHYQAAARAVQKHWGRQPIFVREGGTVRVTTFLEKTLRAPALHLPIGQSSDAPHLPNERIRLLNLITGMRVLEAFFEDVAAGALSHADIA